MGVIKETIVADSILIIFLKVGVLQPHEFLDPQ